MFLTSVFFFVPDVSLFADFIELTIVELLDQWPCHLIALLFYVFGY